MVLLPEVMALNGSVANLRLCVVIDDIITFINQTPLLPYNQNVTKTVSKALIKNRAGAYLLLYRGDSHPLFPGHLDFPGGEVEPHESYKEATAREIWEETGIHVQLNSLEELFAKQYKNVKHILFEANIDKIDIPVKLSWEHKNYYWMTREELLNTAVPNNADPYYVDVIDYLDT